MTRSSKEKDAYLHKLYYDEKYMTGRDLLFYKVSKTDNIKDISRRYIAGWLAKQNVHQLFTAKKPTTNIRPIVSKSPGEFLQMDLIDFSKRPSKEGFKYILNVIDVCSRRLWLEPIYRKTIEQVIPKLNAIIQDIQKDYTVKVIQSDNGGEFKIAFPTIKHIESQPHTPQQQGIVERSNGTIKQILFKVLHEEDTIWDEQIILDVENVYNSTLQSSIGMTPDEAYKLDPKGHKQLHKKQLAIKKQSYKNIETTLNVGDRVRIVLPSTKIKTKGEPLWSMEIYTITKVTPGNPKTFTIPRYQVKDSENIIVKGNYPLSKLLYIPPK